MIFFNIYWVLVLNILQTAYFQCYQNKLMHLQLIFVFLGNRFEVKKVKKRIIEIAQMQNVLIISHLQM